MIIQSNSFINQAPARSAASAPNADLAPRDRVELGSSAPRLMAGVPTGYLVPEIPPPNLFTPAVGIEIIPGLGISLDGKALLVGHKAASEKLEMIGHLADGTYPQRDFKIEHQAGATKVDGYYDWQDYSLSSQGSGVQVQAHDADDNFSISSRADGFDVNSHYTGRTFHVTYHGNTAEVKSGDQQGNNFTITQNGNQTSVDSGYPDLNYTLTRGDDGKISVDGKLKPQDFSITTGGGGAEVTGYYPQQHFVIRPAA